MIEFPLVVRRSARALRRWLEIYLRHRHLQTLRFCHQTGVYPDWYVGN